LLFVTEDPRRRGYEDPPPSSTDVEHLADVRDTIIRLPGRVVAFAGDLTLEEAKHLAGGLLPPVLDDPPAGLEPVYGPVADTGADRTVSLPRLTQVYFNLVRPSILRRDEDFPAYMIATHVLGGHFYSRLYVALRHEGGETYGARATSMGVEVVDVYALSTYTHAENAAVAEEKLRRTLREFHENGITEEEHAAAAGFLKGRRAFSRQAPHQTLGRYLMERRYGYTEGFVDELIERAAATSLEEVNEFIRRYYDPSRFTMVTVVPE
jgi:zinc protease